MDTWIVAMIGGAAGVAGGAVVGGVVGYLLADRKSRAILSVAEMVRCHR